MLRNRMPPESDESRLFTEDEYVRALSFLLPADEAREQGRLHAQTDGAPWILAPDNAPVSGGSPG